MARVSELTSRISGFEGVDTVLSLSSMEDLFLEGDTLVQRPLYAGPEPADIEQLRTRVEQTPLFRNLFLSDNADAVFLHIRAQAGAEPRSLAALLVSELDEPGLHLFGDDIGDVYVADDLVGDLVLLGLLGLGLILVFEIGITRSVTAGLSLSLVSLFPALWVLAAFVLAGEAVSITNVAVPVIVMMIGTSYAVHLYRHYRMSDWDMELALRRTGGVILAAGLTTLVGFFSLAVTPSEVLREVGIFVIIGIIAGLLWSTLVLPAVLARLATRFPIGGPSGGVRAPASHGPGRFVVAGVFTLALVFFAFFATDIQPRVTYHNAFRETSRVTQAVTYFTERLGGAHQLSVFLDGGSDYALVSLERFEELRSATERLRREAGVSRSLSYLNAVEWVLGRLDGRLAPSPPRSEAEIGEALELLSGSDFGVAFDSLVDTGWQRARILLWARFVPGSGAKSLSDIRGALSAELGAATVHLVGAPLRNERFSVYLSRSQLISIVVFSAFLTVFALLLLRNPLWGVALVLPTLAGAIVYFGLLGLLGLPHGPTHVLMIAGFLGISTDDVLYFLLVYRANRVSGSHAQALAITRRQTGVAIVQTSVLLAAGVAVFYFSVLVYLGTAAALFSAAIAASTLTTLFVVPILVSHLPPPRGRAVGAPSADREDGAA
jgi:hypothetical protein